MPLKQGFLLELGLYVPRDNVPLGIDELVLEVVSAEHGWNASHADDIFLKDGPILLHDGPIVLHLLLLLNPPHLHIIVSDCIGTGPGQQAHLAGCCVARIVDTHGTSILAFEALTKGDVSTRSSRVRCLATCTLLLIDGHRRVEHGRRGDCLGLGDGLLSGICCAYVRAIYHAPHRSLVGQLHCTCLSHVLIRRAL